MLHAEGLERQPSMGIGAGVDPSPSVIKLTEILYNRYRRELTDKVREDEHNYRQYLREIEEIGRGEWDHRLKTLEAETKQKHLDEEDIPDESHMEESLAADAQQNTIKLDEKAHSDLNVHAQKVVDRSALDDLEMKDIIADLPIEDLAPKTTKLSTTLETRPLELEHELKADALQLDSSASIENKQGTSKSEMSSATNPENMLVGLNATSQTNDNDSTAVFPNDSTISMQFEGTDEQSDIIMHNASLQAQIEMSSGLSSGKEEAALEQAIKKGATELLKSSDIMSQSMREDTEKTISSEATENSEAGAVTQPSEGTAVRVDQTIEEGKLSGRRVTRASGGTSTSTTHMQASHALPVRPTVESDNEKHATLRSERGMPNKAGQDLETSAVPESQSDIVLEDDSADSDDAKFVDVPEKPDDFARAPTEETVEEDTVRSRTRSSRRRGIESEEAVETKTEQGDAMVAVGDEYEAVESAKEELEEEGEPAEEAEEEEEEEEEEETGPRTRTMRKRRYSTANIESSPRLEDRSSPATPVGSSTAARISNKKFQALVAPLLSNISSNRSASFFTSPVNENDAPDYYYLILQPTDLRTIKAMVKDGRIQNSTELEREIMKMFANAVMYNRWDSDMSDWSREMQRETETLISVFKGAERRGQNGSGTASQPSDSKRRKK
ncbi:hypothetical protein V1512DRAFT_200739 [Lipomyces arxii]|uniref:uncharacterized protein n=1 Tax=Lipomyces arxii TaxID=56418 RepID=UPI0034CDFC01